MGSSTSRHVTERRDRSHYPAPRREAGSASGAGGDVADSLGRITEAPSRGSNGRERSRGTRFRFGRCSSPRHHEAPRPTPDVTAPLNRSSRRSGSFKGTSSNSEDSVPVERPGPDQFTSSWATAESSNSSASLISEGSGLTSIGSPSPEPARIIEPEMPSVGLVMEILPAAIVSTEIVSSSEIPDARAARSSGIADSRSLFLEGNWSSRFGPSDSNGQNSTSGMRSLSQSSRDNTQAACEASLHQHRQNEMQERLRRYAGLPPSLDMHDLERRGILSAESSGTQSNRTGNASSSTSASDTDDSPFRSTPAALQAWEITEEGQLIEYRRSAYSESWETHLAFHRSESQSATGDQPSTPGSSAASLSAAGREARRNGGRRLWDTLTRAASHRRTSPMNAPVPDSVSDSRAQSDDDHLDFRAFHTRSMDLEERRRRVRQQVWALQLLSNGLEGMPGFSRPCSSGGHHHGNCSCEANSSSEDSSTRASISRIIMLAEALFEVLDEIHRQSIALSRTSAPIASLPAPVTVVDAIPIRKFTKVLWEEPTQCNICLVEYEEGDHVRVLPCQHEYHMACVDKWLKEVHRVCPLCRGNVCEANTPAVNLPLPT